MGGGGYAQMGTAISGDIVGGIGGLISALGYKRPSVPRAEGMELRLRQLAQNQLLGGGQQLLGATALYNQLAPILLGQLPGLHYVPGTSGGTTGTGVGEGGPYSSPMASYSSALQSYQGRQAQQQQLNALKAQIKGMDKGPERHAARQQLKSLKRGLKATPPMNQLERQMYMAGAQPGAFDIRMTPGGDGAATGAPAPSALSSLGDINSLLSSLNTGPDFSSRYQTGLGPSGGQSYQPPPYSTGQDPRFAPTYGTVNPNTGWYGSWYG